MEPRTCTLPFLVRREIDLLRLLDLQDEIYSVESLPNCIAPRCVAFPKHLSWVGSSSYLKRTIKFQHLHYGNCNYKWDEENNSLQFNEDYYRRLGKRIPTVYKESK